MFAAEEHGLHAVTARWSAPQSVEELAADGVIPPDYKAVRNSTIF